MLHSHVLSNEGALAIPLIESLSVEVPTGLAIPYELIATRSFVAE
jgi:hypothetical protein